MKLFTLNASICRQFSATQSDEMRTVQKVKDHALRDVVTSLDEKLHKLAAEFVSSSLDGCKLLSEEGEGNLAGNSVILEGEWLVVDPLDGSNNYALSLPGYGFMAAHIVNAKVCGSVVVLPEHDFYFVIEEEMLLTSQPISSPTVQSSSSVYYAYPPTLTKSARKSRDAIISLIDNYSSGFYRYGSSCVGLYNLICGRHLAFIGHGVRIWDALAYFPILERFGIQFRYYINNSSLVLVASLSEDILNEACATISQFEQIEFNDWAQDKELLIS